MKTKVSTAKKTLYRIECFVPKASNVVNDKAGWVVCHRTKSIGRAEKNFAHRAATQPDVKWRVVEAVSVTETAERVLARS